MVKFSNKLNGLNRQTTSNRPGIGRKNDRQTGKTPGGFLLSTSHGLGSLRFRCCCEHGRLLNWLKREDLTPFAPVRPRRFAPCRRTLGSAYGLTRLDPPHREPIKIGSCWAPCLLAGAGGFEPPNAGTKNRCLRPLGYAPWNCLNRLEHRL